MNEKALGKLQIVIIVAVVCAAAIGVSVWWIRHEQITPFGLGENALGRGIEIEAEGIILHYRENLSWSENQFSKIMENQDGFRSAQIEKFNQRYNVTAGDFSVEFDGERRATILKCDVYGKFSGRWYDFHWFLNSLGLDFIDSHFAKSEKELSWQGSIGGVTTTIILRFPFAIDHCHAHVWQK